MQILKVPSLLGAVVALGAPASSFSQERDPTGRYDVREPAEHIEDLREPEAVVAPARPFTIDLSLAGAFSTNAGQVSSDRVETGLATPSAAIKAVPVSMGAWTLRGGLTVDGDYYVGDHNDRFGEGRVEGRVSADHSLGPGELKVGYRALGGFSNDFAERSYTLQITSLAYTVDSDALWGELSAEYHGSDVADFRRMRVTALLAHTLAEPQFGHEVTLGGMLQFSDFRAGDNRGRNDVSAQISLSAKREFANGVTLGWFTAFTHRFSNTARGRFTEFDIGPTLSKTF